MATRTTGRPKAEGGVLKIAKVRDEAPAKSTKKVRGENFGPKREWEDSLSPGLNFLCGGKGEGKSSFQDLISAWGGSGVPVSVHDGQKEAKLLVDDELVYTYQRPKGGQPRITLMSQNTAALVVDPGKLDPATAEEWRLKHVMKLVRAETTEEMVCFFLTHPAKGEEDEPRFDSEAYDYIDLHYGVDKLLELDPVAAVDVLIKGTGGYLHKLKREYRDKATAAEAKYTVANPQKPAQLSELSLEEAETQYRDAVGDHRQVQGEASQRAQLERQRAEIEQTLGDRPDEFQAGALVQEMEEKYGLVSAEIMELEKQLAAARARALNCKVLLDQRRKELTETARAAESWDRRQAILETPITGATAADVAKAAARADSAHSALELARSTEDYRKKLEVAETARKERDAAAAREADIKKLANDLPARLAEQFNRLGIPGARVNEGVLEVKNEQGKWEPFWRRSGGQKWDWILPIHAAHNHGSTMALPKVVLAELQREDVIANNEIFKKHGIAATVEVTTFEGDPMHFVSFEEFLPRLAA